MGEIKGINATHCYFLVQDDIILLILNEILNYYIPKKCFEKCLIYSGV